MAPEPIASPKVKVKDISIEEGTKANGSIMGSTAKHG